MINALGQPQSVLLLGGTSEIGLATLRAWAETCTPHVVIAARPSARREHAVEELRALGLDVEVEDFDAEDTESHPDLVERVARRRDIDVAVVAVGVLEDQEVAWQDHAAAMRQGRVNFLAPVSLGVCLAEVMRRQGHGVVVALSSVAGERVRRSNFVYGAAKAGMDGFFVQLGEALRGSGVSVVVVRPGFVRTRMTAELPDGPLAVDADVVADSIVRAVTSRTPIVWVPGTLRPVMSVLRHVPRPLFRRLPL